MDEYNELIHEMTTIRSDWIGQWIYVTKANGERFDAEHRLLVATLRALRDVMRPVGDGWLEGDIAGAIMQADDVLADPRAVALLAEAKEGEGE